MEEKYVTFDFNKMNKKILHDVGSDIITTSHQSL